MLYDKLGGATLMHRRIVELRKAKKITQEGLAKQIGVTRSALSQYELGIRNPDYDIVKSIADYFGVTTDYLLGRNLIDGAHKEETEIERINRETSEVLKEAKTVEQAKLVLDLAKSIFNK